MHPDRICAALKLAKLNADEPHCNLDSGDGRMLILAARTFGAKSDFLDGSHPLLMKIN